jgi:glycosyltransferase involved in cell wall biosynthesis
MKIAVISKSTAEGGGASRFAENLTDWLLAEGNTTTHFVAHPSNRMKPFQQPLLGRDWPAKIARRTNRYTRRLGLGEIVPSEFYLRIRKLAEEYDVIHFHDHYYAFPISSVAKTSRLVPTFFTAHDCLHFTGGCIYPMDCRRFLDSCGQCPQLKSIGRFDFTSLTCRTHANAAQQSPIEYIYPSQWLLGLASSKLDYQIAPKWLPNGFDTQPYQYRCRDEARRILGLSVSSPIVIVSAHDLLDPRKGAQHALKSISQVRDLAPVVLLVGSPLPSVEAQLGEIPFSFTGYVNSREKLGLLYAAADVFLFCTLQDNLPISVQEAMGAGTAVVGYATGGVPEMIIDGQTGWLAPTGDLPKVADCLRASLHDLSETHRRGILGRTRLNELYGVKRCVDAHLALYTNAIRLRGREVVER